MDQFQLELQDFLYSFVLKKPKLNEKNQPFECRVAKWSTNHCSMLGVSGKRSFINVQSFDNCCDACKKYRPSVHNRASFSVTTAVPFVKFIEKVFVILVTTNIKNISPNYLLNQWNQIRMNDALQTLEHIPTFFRFSIKTKSFFWKNRIQY